MSPDKTPLGYAIKYNSWLFNVPILSGIIFNGAIGVTINKTVHFASEYDQMQEPRKTALIHHEQTHCLQQKTDGWLTFLKSYITKKGRTRYEVEAMRVELSKAVELGNLNEFDTKKYMQLLAGSLANGYRLGIDYKTASIALWGDVV